MEHKKNCHCETANAHGSCKHMEEAQEALVAATRVVEEFDRWTQDTRLQRQGSLEWWLREEIEQLRVALREKQ